MANLIDIITKEMTIRNYSRRTIEAYVRVVSNLYKTVGKPPRVITMDEIPFCQGDFCCKIRQPFKK